MNAQAVFASIAIGSLAVALLQGAVNWLKPAPPPPTLAQEILGAGRKRTRSKSRRH